MAALSDYEDYKLKLKPWENVYGFKMSAMLEKSLAEGYFEFIDKRQIGSKEITI